MSEQNDIVAYFDFDGTLSKFDTFFLGLISVVGLKKMIVNLHKLIIVLINYYVKKLSKAQAKEEIVTILLKDMDKTELESIVFSKVVPRLDKIIINNVLQKLEYHIEHGHTVILVSANLSIFLASWAKLHKITSVIATEIEVDANCKITGKLKSENCYGEQKVERIKNYLIKNNLNFKYSYAYGNSEGDYQMLNYANESFFVTKSYKIISWNKR